MSQVNVTLELEPCDDPELNCWVCQGARPELQFTWLGDGRVLVVGVHQRCARRMMKGNDMGEVKDEIKGPAPKRKARLKTNQNLLDDVSAMMDEVSELTTKKDDDVSTEGDAAAPENIRKAGSLRAVHSLLSAVRTILENY